MREGGRANDSALEGDGPGERERLKMHAAALLPILCYRVGAAGWNSFRASHRLNAAARISIATECGPFRSSTNEVLPRSTCTTICPQQ